MIPFKLNKNLKLGVATASTQVEGGDKNNTWYRWCLKGKIKDGSSCYLANSHWKNYKEHINLMKELNIECYRMSIEWARIEPKENEFDNNALRHYINEIKYLKEKGIEVLVTLHHFSNPIWFEDKGGFKKKKYAVERFKKYTEFVVNGLKDLVVDWCTINEPNVYATNCFTMGEWVNEEKNIFTTFKILRNMSYCHIEAYKIIHKIIKKANVGIALNITGFIPKNPKSIYDKLCAKFVNRAFNTSLVYSMGYGKLIFPLGLSFKKGDFFDYMGINYYSYNLVHGFKVEPINTEKHNDLGWGIYPEGFEETLKKYHELTNKNIYVTENGTCDENDSFRPKFIYDHLKVVSKYSFIKKYFHWTFMDNFEWKEGQSACFGLVKYNYKDETYEPRPSAYFYKEIITNKEISQEMIDKYLKEN